MKEACCQMCHLGNKAHKGLNRDNTCIQATKMRLCLAHRDGSYIQDCFRSLRVFSSRLFFCVNNLGDNRCCEVAAISFSGRCCELCLSLSNVKRGCLTRVCASWKQNWRWKERQIKLIKLVEWIFAANNALSNGTSSSKTYNFLHGVILRVIVRLECYCICLSMHTSDWMLVRLCIKLLSILDRTLHRKLLNIKGSSTFLKIIFHMKR